MTNDDEANEDEALDEEPATDGGFNADDEDGEEGEGEEGEDGEGGKKKGMPKKKLIIIIAGAVVLLIGIGAGLYFTGIIGGGSSCEEQLDDHGEPIPCEEEQAAKDDGHGKKKGKGGHGEEGGGGVAFLEIPTMIVNLNTEDGTPRYLRLSVQLELGDPLDMEAVQAVIPRVIDQFQTYLRELRVKDLRGSSGIYRLQMELLWRVNQAAAPIEIKDVLFQEILIQ